MIPIFRKEFLLGCMGERQVPDIVTKGSKPYDSTPVTHLMVTREIRLHFGVYIAAIGDNIKHSACEMHDTERVFKSLMGCAGEHQE